MKKSLTMCGILLVSSCGLPFVPTPPVPPIISRDNQSDDSIGIEVGKAKNNDYYDFHHFTGERFPSNKLPSVIEKGKEIDVCQTGHIFHNDICYEQLHLTEEPGFRLVKGDLEVTEKGFLSDEFLALFEGASDQLESLVAYRHMSSFKAPPYSNSQSPVFWGRDYFGTDHGTVKLWWNQKTKKMEFSDDLSIDTQFHYPRKHLKEFHSWDYTGTLTLKETVLNFPVTFGQIADVTGDGYQFETKFGSMKFNYKEDARERRNSVLESIRYKISD